MRPNQHKAANALDALFEDDSDLSIEELKAELVSGGVDVEQFLNRFSATVRKGCQSQIKKAAEQSAEFKRSRRSAMFGELGSKTLSELIAIRDQVLGGAFGPNFANAARCRNLQEGTEVSESELRSWLEDISKSSDL